MPKLLFALVLLLSAAIARADIYTCTENGHKIYSQTPCGTDTRSVDLVSPDGSVTISGAATTDSTHAFCKLSNHALAMAVELSQGGVALLAATSQISSYLKGHIGNYDEVLQRNPHFDVVIERLSLNITKLGYNGHGNSDEQRSRAEAECRKAVQDGPGPASQPAPARGSFGVDKML